MDIIEIIFRKILLLIPIIFLISIISFIIIYITPGDPALNALNGPGGPPNQEQVREFSVKMGLDQPIYIQYIKWAERTVHADLGYSYMTGESVLGAIGRCFPATVELSVVSIFITLLISIPLGIIAAVKHDTAIDWISRLFALIGVSIPNFWLAYLLMIIFGLILKLLPTAGYGGGSLQYLILPAFTLGCGYAAMLMRLTRSSMLEVLGQEYIKGAKAKGLTNRIIIFRHAMKNALIPVVTVAGLNFGYLLGGSAIVETIFGWPGVGNLFVNAILTKDYPMVQGCILFFALIYVTINFVVDIAYMFINPRIRYGASD